jgi:hypothetical protein
MKYPLIIGIHNKIRFEMIIIKKPISQLLVSYLETALYINIIWPMKIAIIIRIQKYSGYILYIEKPYPLGVWLLIMIAKADNIIINPNIDINFIYLEVLMYLSLENTFILPLKYSTHLFKKT